MRKTTRALTKGLQKLNFVSRFFNGFPEPDFDIKGCFCDKEFIEPVEPGEQMEISSCIFIAPVIDYQITDLRLLFPV
jgi:hypothetical protein